ncbi:hypothetical protein [Microscilla marina]|uniref:Uncharacterized protein n=1 Tax=Microscilla marina ATCC 23134 TaxID=313606 RepID=A2A0P1_MICM2|nr:hypothetical protein [Microscilla marina]EAY23799.1 hypothetical protein M23134_01302 [Microscilla marina ATCC 23134]
MEKMKRQQPLTTASPDSPGALKKAFACLLWLSILLSSFVVQAQTITWTGATSSDWNTPTNWDTGVVPGASDQVIIPEVTNSPRLDQDRQVGTLNMTDNSSLDLSNFTFTVNERLESRRAVIANGTLKAFKYCSFAWATINAELEASVSYFHTGESTFQKAVKVTYKIYAGLSNGFSVPTSVFEAVTEFIQERGDNWGLNVTGGTFKEKLILTNSSTAIFIVVVLAY